MKYITENNDDKLGYTTVMILLCCEKFSDKIHILVPFPFQDDKVHGEAEGED